MQRVLIGGFGWSGSGAILDMLAQYRGAGYVRRHYEESSFLKGRFSLAALYLRVCRGEMLTKTDFWNMYGGISSYKELIAQEIPASETMNLKRNELLHYTMGEALPRVCLGVLRAGCAFLDEQPDNAQLKDWFHRQLPPFFDRLVEALPDSHFNQERAVAIFNNDPSGYNVDLTRLLNPSVSILVYRDLRDIFATLLKEKRVENTQADAHAFATRHLTVTRNFHKRLVAGNFEPNTYMLNFDRFVESAACRDTVMGFFPMLKVKVDDSYDVELSRQNVALRDKLVLDEDFRPQIALIEEMVMQEWRETMAASATLLANGGGGEIT